MRRTQVPSFATIGLLTLQPFMTVSRSSIHTIPASRRANHRRDAFESYEKKSANCRARWKMKCTHLCFCVEGQKTTGTAFIGGINCTAAFRWLAVGPRTPQFWGLVHHSHHQESPATSAQSICSTAYTVNRVLIPLIVHKKGPVKHVGGQQKRLRPS